MSAPPAGFRLGYRWTLNMAEKGSREYNVVEIAKLAIQHEGILSHVANALQCSRTTLYKYINEDKELQAIFDEANEDSLDKSEYALLAMRDDPEHRSHFLAVKTHLFAKGRHRGWKQKVDVGLTTEDIERYGQLLNSALEEAGVTDEQIELIQSKIGGTLDHKRNGLEATP